MTEGSATRGLASGVEVEVESVYADEVVVGNGEMRLHYFDDERVRVQRAWRRP